MSIPKVGDISSLRDCALLWKARADFGVNTSELASRAKVAARTVQRAPDSNSASRSIVSKVCAGRLASSMDTDGSSTPMTTTTAGMVWSGISDTARRLAEAA